MNPTRYAPALLMLALPMFLAVLSVKHSSDDIVSSTAVTFPSVQEKQIIGPVATLQELESDLQFTARVDTGAKRTSIHVAEMTVVDGHHDMYRNIGKTLRFRLENRQGETMWLARPIAEVALIRTSEKAEFRYLVPLTFKFDGNQREVLVSLNDRSQMSYAMLLGRNYLKGQYVVDVAGVEESDELLVAQR